MAITVDIKRYDSQLIKKHNKAMKEAVQDIVLDLSNTAKGSAPHWKGRLEKGISHDILASQKYLEGTVGVSVIEKGFDYGQFRHDKPFNLGEKSQAKAGGKSGISGKSFGVGDGFIKYPMEANKNAYLQYLDDKFKRAVSD